MSVNNNRELNSMNLEQIKCIDDFNANFNDVAPIYESVICGTAIVAYLDHETETGLVAQIETDALSLEEIDYSAFESKPFKKVVFVQSDSEDQREQIDKLSEAFNQMLKDYINR